MKKLMTLALAFAALVSCSKEENEGIDSNTPVEIKLNAGIEATARAEVSQTTGVSGVQFVRVNGDTPDWTTVSAPSFTGEIKATSGSIDFSAPQFYATDGTNANILGFYPGAKSIAAGMASMEITGEEDVIYAASVSGSKDALMSSIAFSHKLTQFKFEIKRDATTDNDIKNVKITVKDPKTTFSMTLADGTLSNWAVNSPATSITPFTNATAGLAVSKATKVIMLEPKMKSITLTVDATGYPSKDFTINGTDGNIFKEGFAYTITLTFKGTGIEPKATIADWETGTSGSADIQ